uniref:Phosphoglycerate dehydrogenase and related dehydrogenases n=1 Tax=uncultured bacterium Contig1477 TaxID=1393434 RepID=W0FJF4_9BACT|nr:phosphoglycerate dehydrogenase and related dehydrogenases [uncultured bacterium Contig1477]
MYKIQTLNAISDIIHTQLSADKYTVSKDEPVPDAILVRSAAMHEMEFGKELLAIGRAGAGVNNIPIDRCSKEGIVVFNTPGANANAVAELVIAGLMMSGRKIADGIDWVKSLKGKGEEVGKLVEKGKSQFVGAELRGKTLGVIGLGAIGSIVANAASRGLGMNVVGFDPFISVESAWSLSTTIHRAASEEEVIAQADFLTIHMPLNDKTRGSFNAEKFAKMKDGACLLNFARGELVNTADLLAALESGKLNRYVTDFPNDDLIGTDKVVCIPHLGASTPESEENCARMAAAEIRDYLENGSIHNSVNYPEVQLGDPEAVRVLVLHENIPNMISNITAAAAKEGINIENMVNKSKKDMSVTVMEMEELPSKHALDTLAELPGIIRIRTFTKE